MRRIHFIEIEDQAWCPAFLRDCVTDYLQFVMEKANPYKAILPFLDELLARGKAAKIVDLCAGGGGPWRGLLPEIIKGNDSAEVCLTDKFPNIKAFESLRRDFPAHVVFSREKTDAADVAAGLKGARTLFNAFHHFEPEQARRILADAAAKNEPVAVFEITQRRPAAVLVMLLTPLIVLLTTPFIKPFRWSRFFFTYLIPLIPLVVAFDGIVSCLRTYTPAELKNMGDDANKNYHWKSGEIPVKGSLVPITYLVGFPAKLN